LTFNCFNSSGIKKIYYTIIVVNLRYYEDYDLLNLVSYYMQGHLGFAKGIHYRRIGFEN
jgi:hypothetical protein